MKKSIHNVSVYETLSRPAPETLNKSKQAYWNTENIIIITLVGYCTCLVGFCIMHNGLSRKKQSKSQGLPPLYELHKGKTYYMEKRSFVFPFMNKLKSGKHHSHATYQVTAVTSPLCMMTSCVHQCSCILQDKATNWP